VDDRQLRILFNSLSPSLHGGPPTHLPLLEKELRTRVTLETFSYGRKTDSETYLEKIVGRSSDLIHLCSKIRRFRPHLIHHNTAFDPVAILRDAPLVWLAKKTRIPIFLKMHGSQTELLAKTNFPLTQLRNSIFANVQAIGVLSAFERDGYVNACPSLHGRVRVVKNIIREEFHTVVRKEEEHPTILFISRFIREKGMFDLLDAIPAVLKKFPNARFLFVGSGSDAPPFDIQVKERKLSFCVNRIDHIPHLATLPFYASTWALVFPTQRLQEGMPMVVAEAMAAGVPIITTRTKFAQSYMTAERHCLFIEYNNPLSIEQELVYLLERPELRNEMSKNNRLLAQSFKVNSTTDEFINIYHEVISQSNKIRSRIDLLKNNQ
jgi:glycosyltransferase involved in cell wall biosynthesis